MGTCDPLAKPGDMDLNPCNFTTDDYTTVLLPGVAQTVEDSPKLNWFWILPDWSNPAVAGAHINCSGKACNLAYSQELWVLDPTQRTWTINTDMAIPVVYRFYNGTLPVEMKPANKYRVVMPGPRDYRIRIEPVWEENSLAMITYINTFGSVPAGTLVYGQTVDDSYTVVLGAEDEWIIYSDGNIHARIILEVV